MTKRRVAKEIAFLAKRNGSAKFPLPTPNKDAPYDPKGKHLAKVRRSLKRHVTRAERRAGTVEARKEAV